MADLDGKHIVVTGATGGLGGAVVALLLERGAVCHLPMVEREVPSHMPWIGHARVDAKPAVVLTSEDEVTAYYAAQPPLWGSVHLVGGFAMSPIVDTGLADFEKMHQLNAVTAFLCSREAVRSIRRRADAPGAAPGGRIVNVAARPAVSPAGGMIAYTTSKAAVASLTECLAKEVVAENILANAIVPSIIDTPANRASMPSADFTKWPKASELAEAIAFLVSPANRLTSGALVPVYGAA
ncbi:MAG TPA: SDR family NAD(P)-dependent oxidoreductase [Kofleriaceae bacterium]|jgi:NAD(P)-dependent dehydrogenase (short-subunit alcohol dehydrogenase family)|nr:SDR family NAD(P)-dependent oxidoreductase [Kofleriaceae bacterium]